MVCSVKLEVCPKTKHKERKSDLEHQAFQRFGHSDLLHAANSPLQLLQRETDQEHVLNELIFKYF